MKTHQIYFSFLFLAAVLIAHAQEPQTGCVTNPPNFSKLSYNEAKIAVFSEEDLIATGVKKICGDYITNLLNQLEYGHLTNDIKAVAIDLLGTLHPSDSNSIEFLIQNIDFERTKFDPPTRISTQAKYPAKEALMKIGKPVVDSILNHLPTEANQLRRQLMCDVLRRVCK